MQCPRPAGLLHPRNEDKSSIVPWREQAGWCAARRVELISRSVGNTSLDRGITPVVDCDQFDLLYREEEYDE